ncbi:MAG: valine--tRNA ligase [Holophagales bacterium]|nr:valine--tRNA ligase [Holophagales bacterium]MYH25806.1 valine--tRNA ligase [Holophagales bacterium]
MPEPVMEKRFEPASYEGKWQAWWDEQGLYRCAPDPEGEGPKPYCILIPPPNVTGKLHMGHALQSTLQDLITRWRRMRGDNALWLPGTDHAGIATQLMVERHLEERGSSRIELGREKFVERVWQWKHEYHANIRSQLQRLGASCDWSRERFTLDDGLARAVRTAFVRLYQEGLIYRGEHMVNWSPVLRTAVSDLEVENREVQGRLYHLSYALEPLSGSSTAEEPLVVATTRPETMLGDTAVAFHPEDERYRHLAGRTARLPILGRRLRLVADDHVDPAFGSGLVKVTPYHDPNDYEIGRRHDLPGVRVIGFDGRMTAEAGPGFEGLDRFEARRRVVERLEAEGRLVKVEPHVHSVGHSQRSGEPIEPMLSPQWFADVSGMAQEALAVVERGDINLIPSSWDRTWEHWLRNIRPWVISRQLWWGHRIPAWYDTDGACYVAMDRAAAEEQAGTTELTRDPDVLDTWFSSGLWPISTLGWPDEEAPDLRTWYPTEVLITGFDILFFWVARMVMLSRHLYGKVPFRAVHLTGLVRDADGEKMSKTKGNTVDPMDLIEEYGADAMRFTLAVLDVPGRDIPLDLERMAGYRAFGNKIWNAVRFALARTAGAVTPTSGTELEREGLAAAERWILSRLSDTAATVNDGLEEYRFDWACNALYHFFWHELCDWYIEFAKPALAGSAPRPRVAETLLFVLDASLRLLHPVMPHLTEELWQRLPRDPSAAAGEPRSISVQDYPLETPELADQEADRGMEALIAVVQAARSLRRERNLAAAVKMSIVVEGGDSDLVDFVVEQEALLNAVARVSGIGAGTGADSASRSRAGGLNLAFEVEAAPMGEAERAKLGKELDRLDAEIAGARNRLSNAGFLAKAPAHVVEGNRSRLAELEERRSSVMATLGQATRL